MKEAKRTRERSERFEDKPFQVTGKEESPPAW
jgi:hypothetical protein